LAVYLIITYIAVCQSFKNILHGKCNRECFHHGVLKVEDISTQLMATDAVVHCHLCETVENTSTGRSSSSIIQKCTLPRT